MINFLFICIFSFFTLIINLLIRLEVKELSRFTDKKEKKVFSSPSVFIDEVEWKLRVFIQSFENKTKSLINKRDTYIGIFLYTSQKSKFW